VARSNDNEPWYDPSEMATQQKVRDAEGQMLGAQAALQEYVERSEPGTVDIALHLRLAEELKRSTDEYVRLLSEFLSELRS
jgi:hypothetical protein